jgi:hypothetical protein
LRDQSVNLIDIEAVPDHTDGQVLAHDHITRIGKPHPGRKTQEAQAAVVWNERETDPRLVSEVLDEFWALAGLVDPDDPNSLAVLLMNTRLQFW